MSVKRYEWVACDEHACHCDVVESAEGDMVDYEDYAALEAKCAVLAAEVYDLKHPGTYLPSKRETPALDAFLAEVRAGAVDEVCLKISNAIVNCYQDEQIGLDAAATICGDFAAKLRKGVQS